MHQRVSANSSWRTPLPSSDRPQTGKPAGPPFLEMEQPPSQTWPRCASFLRNRSRRRVPGRWRVQKAIANPHDFNPEFQELITRYAWGTIWTRPVLSQRTRRLLVLATTAALGRWEEFTLHVRAGLAHELEPCDL